MSSEQTYEAVLNAIALQPGATMRQLIDDTQLKYRVLRQVVATLYQSGYLNVYHDGYVKSFYPSERAIDWLNNTS